MYTTLLFEDLPEVPATAPKAERVNDFETPAVLI
jgi:hypothetical protein